MTKAILRIELDSDERLAPDATVRVLEDGDRLTYYGETIGRLTEARIAPDGRAVELYAEIDDAFAAHRWLNGGELELHNPDRKDRPIMEITRENLGETYTDAATGFTGRATGVFHYLDGSTRVMLEAVDADGKPVDFTVDEGRLRSA